MMLSLFLTALLPFTHVSAAATPSDPSDLDASIIEKRQGWDWPKCLPTGPNYCTVYMATGDTSQSNYRTAALFDNNCDLKQVLMTSKNNPKITLKGHLPYYVDLWVDDSIHPRGYLSYIDSDLILGDSMACYKYPETDGVGCRKAFQCIV